MFVGFRKDDLAFTVASFVQTDYIESFIFLESFCHLRYTESLFSFLFGWWMYTFCSEVIGLHLLCLNSFFSDEFFELFDGDRRGDSFAVLFCFVRMVYELDHLSLLSL